MHNNILFAAVFLALLILPGLALSLITRQEWIKRCRFLFVITVSYTLFVLILCVAQVFQVSWNHFTICIGLMLLFSATATAKYLIKPIEYWKFKDFILSQYIPIMIVVAISCYQILVGPYNEIPADIYAHISYFQTAFDLQQQEELGKTNLLNFFSQKGLVWYHFLAFCSIVSGASIEAVIYATTWLTKALFLLAVYFFSLRIFEQYRNCKTIASLTTLFLALHMGINVIAYIRYYSFAPTMLNFILYFSVITVFLSLLKTQKISVILFVQTTYIILVTFAAAAIHTQEALFIAVMIALISTVAIFLPKRQKINGINDYLPHIISIVAILSFFTLYFIARAKLDRAPNISWRLWEFGSISEWLPKLTILNLKYQFMRTITLWGILIYIAIIFYWREFRQNTFLIAGLISPVFTVLNPFFVDLFLRLDNSTTLWRMSYLIPLHFSAAFLVVKVIQQCCDSNTSNFQKIFGSIFIVLSVLLLLPFKNTYADIHYSRFPTLMAVNSQNNYEHINDAIAALNAVKKKHIVLTDPVTGYVISGMTHHHSYRYKFFPRSYLNFSFDDYTNLPLRKHKGKLLLFNSRSEARSDVGALARHWPETILDVSQYYPEALTAHLESNPIMFSLLWESKKGDMRLYKIL